MRRIAALILSTALVAGSGAGLAVAQVEEAPETGAPAEEDGLMKRGAEMFLRGLMDELDPALRGLEDLAGEMQPALRSFVEEMGPALHELMGKVRDWSDYHPPEMLPNGDIILRKRLPGEEEEEAPSPFDSPSDGSEIEL